MSIQLQVTEKPTYLHAVVAGPNTRENVTGYLQALRRECEARQCFNVLIEERLSGRPREDFLALRREHGAEYERLDRELEGLATRETPLGEFTSAGSGPA